MIDMKGKAPTHTKGESESVMFDKRHCTVSFLHMEDSSRAAVYYFHCSINGIKIKAVNVIGSAILVFGSSPYKNKGVSTRVSHKTVEYIQNDELRH